METKELSMMDYEKKYKEALEREKEMIDSKKTFIGKECLEHIFPELAESEDERMLREFNDYLCEEIECRTNDIRDEKDRKTLNMLRYVLKKVDTRLEKQKEPEWNKKPCLTCQEYEKGFKQGHLEGCTAGYNKAMKEMEQKEQKPGYTKEQVDKIRKDLYQSGYNDGYKHGQEMQKEQNTDKCQGCNNVKGCINCVDGDQWAYIEEQKPPLTDFEAAIYSYLSDDTSGKFSKEVMHKCAVERAKVLLELARKEQKPVDEEELSKFCEANFNAGKRVVLNNPEEYGLQKPAEWSEEDERWLKLCIGELQSFWKFKEDKLFCKKKEKEDWREGLISWLKSLRPQPQPKWSEEDENMLTMILGDLEWERRNTTVNKDINLYDEKIAWFKSLRPSWKPSEEQMKALKMAVFNRPYDCDILEELYEQLKAL